jgi:hypothetical protein
LSLPFAVERTHPTVTTVRMDDISAGWQQWFLLRSDAHHDNQYCDHELEKKHLDEAKDRNAGILDWGDLFCVMGGKWDKRADPRQLPEAIRNADKPYQDAVVAYNAAFYEPYALNWVMLAIGNHESEFAKRHETNLVERLAERLKVHGSPVQVGGYQGWVRFMFQWNQTKQKSVRLRYTHGYGGGGPVTKDVIQSHRQMAFLGNADILVSGHTHDKWHVRDRQEILDVNGRPVLVDVDCIKCGSYKDEYSAGTGWACTKGFGPKPLGGWWLRFWLEGDTILREVVEAR